MNRGFVSYIGEGSQIKVQRCSSAGLQIFPYKVYRDYNYNQDSGLTPLYALQLRGRLLPGYHNYKNIILLTLSLQKRIENDVNELSSPI